MTKGFGARLKDLRQRVGMTQQTLAQTAGLSVSTISRLEQGGQPTSATVVALARALNVPAESLAPSAEGEPTVG